MRLLDPDLLRTFSAFADAGSLARAAEVVGRSPSAVTAQMQRLEGLLGEALLARAGRGRVLTPAGEDLLIHARRILAAHQEAWLSVKGTTAEGRLSLAATQDFVDDELPRLVRAFARTHPRVRIEFRVGRSAALAREFQAGAVDVLLAMRLSPAPDEVAVLREQMVWLAAADGLVADTAELPLALLDAPCGFRDAALHVLDQAARPYRVAATSGSLAGVRAAVRAGLAVTLRTARWAGDGIVPVPEHLALPAVPAAEFSVRIRREAPPQATDFAALLQETLVPAAA